MNKTLSTIGILIKEEQMKFISDFIVPNSLVLEILEPFPGYYGENTPEGITPYSIFIITKKEYKPEIILRASQKIKQYSDIKFSATPAFVKIFNKKYFAIRIKNLKSYEHIKTIQTAFLNEKIELHKKIKIDNKAIIEVYKYFELENIKEGLYLSIVDKNMGYIKINKYLSWKLFEKITHLVRNNVDDRYFDAAWTTLFKENKVLDLIRIYKEKISPELLEQIQKQYNKVLLDY